MQQEAVQDNKRGRLYPEQKHHNEKNPHACFG